MKSLIWQGLIIGLIAYAIYSGFIHGFGSLAITLILSGVAFWLILQVAVYFLVGLTIALLARKYR